MRRFLTATYVYQAPTMVATVPGRPIPRANATATLSLVSNPCPPPLLLLSPKILVGKGVVVKVVAVDLCAEVAAVELTAKLSAAACADEDELEEEEEEEEEEREEEERVVIG